MILEIRRHVPPRYEVDEWDIVFPLDTYTVGTFEPARALNLSFLQVIPAVGVYISLPMWLAVGIGGVIRARRHFEPVPHRGHLQ